MINPQSNTGKAELETPAPLFLDLNGMVPERQIWFRRKIYLKVPLLLISFVGVSLLMLVLDW